MPSDVRNVPPRQASSSVSNEVQTDTVAPSVAEAVSQMRGGANGKCRAGCAGIFSFS
eukprot:SAG31_NODE_44600_length_262_cov_0.631902_1_plen_56_part_01